MCWSACERKWAGRRKLRPFGRPESPPKHLRGLFGMNLGRLERCRGLEGRCRLLYTPLQDYCVLLTRSFLMVLEGYRAEDPLAESAVTVPAKNALVA